MSIGWEKYSTRTDSVRMLARNCSKLMLQLPGIAPSPAAAGGCCAAPPDCCCAAPPDCCCAAPDSPRWLLLLISQIWSSWLSLDEMAAGLLRLAGPGATCQQERLHGCHLDQIIFGFISTSDTQNTTGTDTMGIIVLIFPHRFTSSDITPTDTSQKAPIGMKRRLCKKQVPVANEFFKKEHEEKN